MAALLTTIAGETGALFFQLLDSGSPIDLSDFTVTLLLAGVDNVAISITGTVTVMSPPTLGIVAYTPSLSDLTAILSPFKTRWQLVDDSGTIYYVPSAYRDEWDVVSA